MNSAWDADMSWRKADGTTGTYQGDLFDLGMGIPRRIPAWGIRAAVWDFCFGYVSGFPLRDILPFALRSLFPGTLPPMVDVDDSILEITCEVPPAGWYCTRPEGHDGPCAAHLWRDDPRWSDHA